MKKPARFRNKPKVGFVRRKVFGDSFFVINPKKDSAGKGSTRVERHTYTFALPKKRRWYIKDGDKQRAHVEKIYKFLQARYGASAEGIGYIVEGKSAVGLNSKGKPDWDRKPGHLYSPLTRYAKSKREAMGRVRALGNNEMGESVGVPGAKFTSSEPAFFVAKTIQITIISKPNKRLKRFTGSPANNLVAPWDEKRHVKTKKRPPLKPRKTRHRR